jgi:hypothetical protein
VRRFPLSSTTGLQELSTVLAVYLNHLYRRKIPMRRSVMMLSSILFVSTASLAFGQGMKVETAECDSLWMKVNPSGAEKVPESAAGSYITDLKAANPDGDGTIEKNEFSDACTKGLIKSSSSSGGEASGATPKTEPPKETSDRTPEKKTDTPLPQKDTDDGKTSDRTPEKK